MTQSHRAPQGGRIDRDAPLRFSFNGISMTGYRGDTLASALLANGVHFVARSFKYHRPRGIVAAGVDEPNALVQLGDGALTVPNARATEIELFEGLSATSVNAEPSLERDRMAVTQWFARFLPAGFYYKTFMWPRSWWGKYEHAIRQAAGLGVAPALPDPDRYEKTYAHCDVLVAGGGPAGLIAALDAARRGARVMLVDDQPELGGQLLHGEALIDGESAVDWVADIVRELAALPEVTLLRRSTAFGYQDHNLVTVCERLTDHLAPAERRGPRERLWKVRARQVVLATGAHERPLVFGDNDLPGIMLASAISTYIHRYGVVPGKRAVIFTNNDSAYRTAIDLAEQGASVTVVDARADSQGELAAAAKRLGVSIIVGAVIAQAHGKRHIESVSLAHYANGMAGEPRQRLACDLLGMSGGWNPVVHLFAQSGGKARWWPEQSCFVPGVSVQAEISVGAARGEFGLAAILQSTVALIGPVFDAIGLAAGASLPAWQAAAPIETPLSPLWWIKGNLPPGRGPKQFVDYQNDVSVADIHLAVREGYESVEHVKRYTAMGFGTDQGKLGNINGMAVLADALGQRIEDTGTTTFRPNYTPVTFGTLAGRELGDFHDPVRKTCIHAWHVAQGAAFEDVGNWKRPWYYPRPGEDIHAAVARECLAVRQGVGMLDASTLGKIEVKGPDAATLLNWVYTNPWTKLEVGRCRYGLMLDENGMVFDDGVTARLGEDHFLMSTTTGGAARVLSWMERWLQTEWPDLKVHLTSVTDHFATFAVAGPHSRRVLQKVCEDIDFANAAFPFMSWREGSISGVFARIMRISFSGELAYEVNVPANFGQAVWDLLIEAGREFDLTTYGTETMHVLRAEKGFIIVGQDTDGSVTPNDLGMGGLIAKTKDFLGKRSLARSDTARADRKQLVGLLTEDPATCLPEGSQIVAQAGSLAMIGHVTSSYFSPVLNRSIALALIEGGLSKLDQTICVPLLSGANIAARISSPVFYDKAGERQHVE